MYFLTQRIQIDDCETHRKCKLEFRKCLGVQAQGEEQGHTGMEDEKIIDLYWDRDQRAIRQTAEKYGSYCGRIAKNILSNKEDCEECVNDTWLRAWNAMPDERPAILSAFLGAITRNLSLDRYRKQHTAKRGNGEVAFIFDELTDHVDKTGTLHRGAGAGGVYQPVFEKPPERASCDVCAAVLVF